jgi:hypothetical protein
MKRRGEMPGTKRSGVRGVAARGAAGVCLVLLLSALALSGCRVGTGSGKLVTTKVDATGFTKVKANDSWDVTLVRGDSYSVRVTCDDDLVDKLDVVSDGGTLVLRLKPQTSWFSFTSRETLKATVVMPRLDGLELTDSSKAGVTGFSAGGSLAVRLGDASSAVFHDLGADALDVQAADACSLSGSIQVDQASLRLSDSSSATLDGSARALNLRASDGSTANLRGLQTMDTTVTLKDASRATVAVSGTLDANVSDGSDLRYLGSPKLSEGTSASDGSSLSRIGEGE